jgi:seryl-tRNA synthetase
MIDINWIRADPERAAAALAKRGPRTEFHQVLEWDDQRRDLITETDTLRGRRNDVSSQIPRRKQRGEDVRPLFDEMRGVGQRIKALDEERSGLERRISSFLEQLPNAPDDDVVAGGKENNRVLHAWLERPDFDFAPRDHLTLADGLGLIDFARGAKVAGNGFWIYRGAGALLEMALINYCITRNVAAGYELMLPPHIVNAQCGYISGQFPKFGQDVYRLAAGQDHDAGDAGEAGGDGADDEGQILIPTSETALAAMHQDEILAADTLPRKYCAFSPCYRREAGSYRSHDRGTIRGHQFHKVELFQFVAPDQSDAALHGMVDHAESLVRDLGLHYRVSLLAAGDCSAAAAKTCDIEVWIPSMGSYEEVSSASNTRDYQSRRGRIRMRGASGSALVHTLNASGLATSRLLPALLESCQRADGGITIPEVLRPFCGLESIEPGA